MKPEAENSRAIADFFDGRVDGDSFRRFGEWLEADPANLAAFVDHLQVEEDIRRLSLYDDVSRYADSENQAARGNGRPLKLLETTVLHRLGIVAVATAASLMVALLVFRDNREPAVELLFKGGAAAESPAIVATLGDIREPRWQANSYASGQHFTIGSALNLVSGAAQLTFETGAVLVMQGPCQLDLGENSISLSHGRVSAVVPPSASGFSVLTPSSEVIDIGTEFGVSVDETDGTQVHVFSGEVITRARNRLGETVGEPMLVTTHNAIHFRPGTDEAQRFQADEEAFVRWLADQSDPLHEVMPPVEGRLALWLSSDHWNLDNEGRVNVWRDTLSPFNRIPHNALQAKPSARPRVVSDAIGGWPAVRFDGEDDCLITTPISTGDSQTIALVASIRENSAESVQIINYNGPPQLRTWMRQDPNILQIVTRIDGQGRAGFHPFVFLGFSGEEGIRVGEAANGESIEGGLSTTRVGEPFVAVYLYDRANNHAELWINNRSVGSSTAPAAIAVTSRKVIGRHGGYPLHFRGDIAEVMIYDEGLDGARIDSLARQLAEKYRISR